MENGKLADDDKAAKSRLQKISKLLEVLEDLEVKKQAVVAEIHALAAGRAGIGQRIKALRLAYFTAWGSRYQGVCAWEDAKNSALAKRLFAQGFTDDALAQRVTRYVRDSDEFLVRARHPFGWFYASINRYAEIGNGAELALDAEADATARQQRELRNR